MYTENLRRPQFLGRRGKKLAKFADFIYNSRYKNPFLNRIQPYLDTFRHERKRDMRKNMKVLGISKKQAA